MSPIWITLRPKGAISEEGLCRTLAIVMKKSWISMTTNRAE